MNKKEHEYLLLKYAIWFSSENSILFDVLRKLDNNKKLDETDKKCIQDNGLFRLYAFVENWEATDEYGFHALHHGYPLAEEGKHKEILIKYNIQDPLRNANLYHILHNLENNKKLDEAERQWIRDKEMSKLDKFIENWETTGKADYSVFCLDLHTSSEKRNNHQHIINVKNSNKSKQNNTSIKDKERSSVVVATDMRKSHMPLHYKKAILIKHIKSNLEQITPSNIPEDISSLFLPKVWDTINESIKKDINELFNAYYSKLWTATSLMAYRIFENVLKVHITHDLKEESAQDITDAIKKLKKNKYDSHLLKTLDELKENRNSFMHGNIRASTQEAKESIVKVISLAMNIHNIKP